VIKINGSIALVDFSGIVKEINISLVKGVKVGEYVMVHAGFAIEKMDNEYVKEMQRYLNKKSKN